MSAGSDRFQLLRALGWGAFLACSWTWCIGLFLPVYLVRDFGWHGWIAFAVPNVIGAASVGIAWRRSGASDAFVEQNAGAMRTFSAWTIFFHTAFLGWLLAIVSLAFLDDWAPGAGALGFVIILALALGAMGSAAFRRVAVFVYISTWVLLVLAARTGPTIGLPAPTGMLTEADLALLFPVIAFGFLLCPHLDLTLHRARQECSGSTGTAAFLVGFGVLFLGMIVVSMLYATHMSRATFSLYTIGLISLQGVFTMGAHWRELFERGVVLAPREPSFDLRSRRRRAAVTGVVTVSVLLIAILIVAALSEGWIDRFLKPRMSSRELVYKCLLAPYALCFPAWVWIVSWRPHAPRRRRIVTWLIAGLAAAPCLWFGLIQGPFAGEPARWYWLLPIAAAIPALAPLALRRAPQAAVESAARTTDQLQSSLPGKSRNS